MRGACLAVWLVAVAACLSGNASRGEESPQRTWSDASGTFSVEATLQAKAATAVTLLTADGRVVEVPIARLSEEDRAYLTSHDAPADNPFAGGVPAEPMQDESAAEEAPKLPPVELPANTLSDREESASAGDTLALPGTGTTIDLTAEPDEDVVVGPDPRPADRELPAGVVAVAAVDAYDKVSGPVWLGGDLFAVAVGRNKSGAPEETRGRLFVANLQDVETKQVSDVPVALKVLGSDVATGRTLVIDSLDQFQRAGDLVMLEGVAGGDPQLLYRRSLPGLGKPGFQPMLEWAALLSGSHVAGIVDGGLLVWDLPAAQTLYRIEKVRATEPPALSGSGRYMAVSQPGRVTVLETATGKVARSLATGWAVAGGVAFDASGARIAVCASNQYLIWDWLADDIVAEGVTTDQLGSWPLAWVSDTRFRTALGSVVDIALGMPVWKYHVAVTTGPQLFGDKLLTVTTSQQASLVSLAMPHPAAKQALAQLLNGGDEAMLVRPGVKVAIAVEGAAGEDAAAIEAALTQSAEAAGWKVAKRAKITLVARLGRGEQQQLSYRMMGSGRSQDAKTATLVPFTADLEIRAGDTVLWQRSSTNHVPSLLRLEEGETVQDAVKRYEKPDPAFFGRLNLPPRIPRPEVADQIGMSSLKDGAWMDIPAAIRNRTRSRQ